ncbi:MAG TPA: acyl-CoA dehydrogenase [Mycobacteriales bacterium]|nr:acyl-CoA dehydrogenase [Mycobacteriales bacterium]
MGSGEDGRVAPLRRALDGPWWEARDQVRATLRDPLFAPRYGLTADEQRALTLERLVALAKTDGPAWLFPRAYGGLEDPAAGIAAFEVQAFSDLSLLVKSGVQWGLFGGAVLRLGTARHHQQHLAGIIDGTLLGCFAMTETGHGSDVQSLRTTATYDPATDELVVHTPDDTAAKDYIGNAALHGRLAVVFAQLSTQGEQHGVHAVLVPIRDDAGRPCPGVRIEDDGLKAGLNGVDNGRLLFDHVRVPRDALLDRFGQIADDGTYSSPIDDVSRRFFTMLGTLVQGRVSISGAAVSATKCALTIAVRHGERRRQFTLPGGDDEVPLLDYRAHQRLLLPALATTCALSFAQLVLVQELATVLTAAPDDADARRRLETRAAAMKVATTAHAVRTIQTCREACGGAGYLAVNQLAALRADTDVFATFEGANTVLQQLVAKTLLTRYQAEFGELDARGTVRFVADHVVEAVIERSGARGILQRIADLLPSGDDDHPFDRDRQLALLVWREKHVLDGLARRLRKGVESGRDAFAVVNDAQDHLLLAASAHTDALVLEAFADAVDAIEDDDARALMSKVCDLHALATVERDRAWFLEHGRLTPARSKAVTVAVNDLCAELRPHARVLVDAFGIPDELITAPIAQR